MTVSGYSSIRSDTVCIRLTGEGVQLEGTSSTTRTTDLRPKNLDLSIMSHSMVSRPTPLDSISSMSSASFALLCCCSLRAQSQEGRKLPSFNLGQVGVLVLVVVVVVTRFDDQKTLLCVCVGRQRVLLDQISGLHEVSCCCSLQEKNKENFPAETVRGSLPGKHHDQHVLACFAGHQNIPIF